MQDAVRQNHDLISWRGCSIAVVVGDGKVEEKKGDGLLTRGALERKKRPWNQRETTSYSRGRAAKAMTVFHGISSLKRGMAVLQFPRLECEGEGLEAGRP